MPCGEQDITASTSDARTDKATPGITAHSVNGSVDANNTLCAVIASRLNDIDDNAGNNRRTNKHGRLSFSLSHASSGCASSSSSAGAKQQQKISHTTTEAERGQTSVHSLLQCSDADDDDELDQSFSKRKCFKIKVNEPTCNKINIYREEDVDLFAGYEDDLLFDDDISIKEEDILANISSLSTASTVVLPSQKAAMLEIITNSSNTSTLTRRGCSISAHGNISSDTNTVLRSGSSLYLEEASACDDPTLQKCDDDTDSNNSYSLMQDRDTQIRE